MRTDPAHAARQAGGQSRSPLTASVPTGARMTATALVPKKPGTMAIDDSEAQTTRTPIAHRPPLGLPNGSVRALLTLLIVAVVISQVARGQHVSTLWTETLMIALAHYFSTRRFIKLAPELIHQLEAEGAVETELHPRRARGHVNRLR